MSIQPASEAGKAAIRADYDGDGRPAARTASLLPGSVQLVDTTTTSFDAVERRLERDWYVQANVRLLGVITFERH